MNNYKKFSVFSPIIASAIFLIGFMTFWPKKPESLKAFEFFKKSQYEMALGFANKSPLLEAYILRESHHIETSNAKLKKALRKVNTTKELVEIELNLVFNAYLLKDRLLFNQHMVELKKIENSGIDLKGDLPFFSIFKALDAFFEKDYEHAYFYFEKQENSSFSSPWMEYAFKKEFNDGFIAENMAFSLMQTGRFHLAQEKLKAIKKQNESRYYFLKAFYATLLKHSDATKYLAKIDLQKFNSEDYIIYFDFAKKYCVTSFQKKSWEEFCLWQDFFNYFVGFTDLHGLIESLKNEGTPAVLSQKLRGELLVKLLYISSQEVKQAFILKDFETIEKNIGILEDEFLIEKANIVCFELLNCKNESTETCIRAINFWSKIEKNREKRLAFSKKLVALTAKIWFAEAKPEKAKELFKLAFIIPFDEDKKTLLEILEDALLAVNKKAIESDLINHYYYVLEVAKALNLNMIKLYNQQEKNDLLKSAKIFLSRGHYKQALERARFLLLLDEQNKEAKDLMKLIKRVYD